MKLKPIVCLLVCLLLVDPVTSQRRILGALMGGMLGHQLTGGHPLGAITGGLLGHSLFNRRGRGRGGRWRGRGGRRDRFDDRGRGWARPWTRRGRREWRRRMDW